MRKDRRARLNNYEIYSIDGDVAVDFVGRYRDARGRTSSTRSNRSGFPSTGNCRAPRPRSAGRSVPYRDYYDDDTRDIVGGWYRREIELLDYAF